MASSTARGFWLEAAESRYTMRWPLICAVEDREVLADAVDVEVGHGCCPPRLVAVALEPLGQLHAAAVHDAAVDQDVHPVGLHVRRAAAGSA